MNAVPFGGQFIATPFPWVALAGFFIGAAASCSSMRTKNARDPSRMRTRKWVFVCAYLSAAVVLGLLGVFLPGPEKILDPRLSMMAAVIAVPAFLCMRFKKAVGIPVVLLLLLGFLLISLLLSGLHAFSGETEIAVVRVISIERNSMKLGLIPRDGDPVLLTMEGDHFAPKVKVVVFGDPYVFLGAKTWYRFEGLTSFARVKQTDGNRIREGGTNFTFPRPTGISEILWNYFERIGRSIPGVKTVRAEMDPRRSDGEAREFEAYSVRVRDDGVVLILPLSG